MRLPWILGALAAADEALSFSDTSPFFSWSTVHNAYSLGGNGKKSQEQSIATRRSVESLIQDHLSQCSSMYYLFVDQEGGTADDYETLDGESKTPHLSRSLGKASNYDRIVVSSVVGGMEGSKLAHRTAQGCDRDLIELGQPELPPSTIPRSASVLKIKLAALPTGSAKARAATLSKNDAYLNVVLEHVLSGATTIDDIDWTVIYTTSPGIIGGLDEHNEEQEEIHDQPARAHTKQAPFMQRSDMFPDATLAQHYRRDTTAYPRRTDNSSSSTGSVALFERYEFFSPAIFMGGLVSLLLVMVSIVGVRAIAGLEVSYAAFSREMGPGGSQKKAQ